VPVYQRKVSMKFELEPDDIQLIAKEVAGLLRPLLHSREEPEDEVYDVKGLCSYLKVKPSWVYEAVHRQRIPHFKVGQLLRFRKKDIDRWLDRQKVPTLERRSL
jgi:excisionase family DNA binding protein